MSSGLNSNSSYLVMQMMAKVGGRGGIMQKYQWKQVPTKETEMTVM